MSTKNGGSAFPVVGMSRVGSQGVEAVFQSGMTLRDYFAAKAMQTQYGTGFSSADERARCAYTLADAMLAARESGR